MIFCVDYPPINRIDADLLMILSEWFFLGDGLIDFVYMIDHDLNLTYNPFYLFIQFKNNN